MFIRTVVLCGLLVGLTGCGDDDDPVDPVGEEETTSFLEVSITASGDDIDSDGVTVVIDGGNASASITLVEAAGAEVFELEEGSHTVELTDVAENCTVEEENPQTVTLEATVDQTVGFTLTCTAIL